LHKKRIKNKNYYYHTVRNSENETKTVYLGSNEKLAKKKAREMDFNYKKPVDFSWINEGHFFLLALSLIMLSLVGFLAVLYAPEEGVFLSSSNNIDYKYSIERNFVNVAINNNFEEKISVEIKIIDSNRNEEVFIKKIDPGENLVSLSYNEKISKVFVKII